MRRLWGCPRFSVQRRQPQASDVDNENAVKPKVGVEGSKDSFSTLRRSKSSGRFLARFPGEVPVPGGRFGEERFGMFALMGLRR